MKKTIASVYAKAKPAFRNMWGKIRNNKNITKYGAKLANYASEKGSQIFN